MLAELNANSSSFQHWTKESSENPYKFIKLPKGTLSFF